MADRPLLFSAPMVRALLEGRKTQTRRVIEPYEAVLHPFKGNRPAPCNLIQLRLPARFGGFIAGPAFNPRYAVGDRLYVREHWRCEARFDDFAPRDIKSGVPIYYAADPDPRDSEPGCAGRFRQGMFMPRWASRLTLTVTDVRVERLQDISEADAVAEGCAGYVSSDGEDGLSPQEEYRDLWNSIHGPGAWAENPWVCAITFGVHKCNIDQMGKCNG